MWEAEVQKRGRQFFSTSMYTATELAAILMTIITRALDFGRPCGLDRLARDNYLVQIKLETRATGAN